MHRVHVNSIISKTTRTAELDTPAMMGILPSVVMGAVLPAVVAVVPSAVSPGVDGSMVVLSVVVVAASTRTTAELDTPATVGVMLSVVAVEAVVPSAVSPGVDGSMVVLSAVVVAASVVGQG